MLMQIQIKLYGTLRELLPPEKRGRDTLTLPTGATVADLLGQLGAPPGLLVAVNQEHESAYERPLQEGDKVAVFQHAAGG